MAEDYWQAEDDIANASLRFAESADPNRLQRGEVLLSVESQPQPPDLQWLVTEDFHAFLSLLGRHLCKSSHLTRMQAASLRDLYLCYYVLRLSQATLGRLFGLGQSHTSSRLRNALKRAIEATNGTHRKWQRTAEQFRASSEVVIRTDPDCLGQFRIQAEDIQHFWRDKAGIREDATDATERSS